MHTNDTHANVERIPRRITAIKQIRAEKKNTLLLDGGDVFSGTLYFNKFEGLADLELMNLAGYDAMTLGNHEFDKGPAVLAKFVKGAKFPIVSANIDFSKDKNFTGMFIDDESMSTRAENGKIQNGIVKVIDGKRVGIFGLTTAETVTISSPGKDIVFEDYIKEAKSAVSAFKAQGINKIIAVTHIGLEDGGGDNDVTLAKEVDGIDIIVGGHSHSKVEKPVVDTSGSEPTVIVQANEYGQFLGTLDVTFDKDGKITSHAGKLISIDEKVKKTGPDGKEVEEYVLKEDATAAKIVNEKYKPAIEAMKNTVVAKSDVELIGGNPAARSGETNLGNLIADGMLAKAKTVNPNTLIALQNGGGVRTTIKPGNITLEDVFKVLPFSNALGILELTGAEIKTGLEHGLQETPKPSGGFLQVAGLKIVYDEAQPKGSKLVSVEVKGNDGKFSPLKDTTKYFVATNIFTAKGGDGYEVFKKAANEGRLSEVGFVDWEVFQDHLKSLKTVTQKTEGRITKGQNGASGGGTTPSTIEIPATSFSGSAAQPATYNGDILVNASSVQKLENAVVNGNLTIKGNNTLTLNNVSVSGNTTFVE